MYAIGEAMLKPDPTDPIVVTVARALASTESDEVHRDCNNRVLRDFSGPAAPRSELPRQILSIVVLL
jgi:hypothetical protein